jgi:hypothetical protein
MSIKMKGLVKSIKLLSQIFVYKDQHEMEIGFPTDVQHVAHIGWDGQNANNPRWMEELKTSSDFSTGSFADSRETSWASQGKHTDFDQPKDIPSFGIFSEATCPPDIPKAPKKIKKKKTRPPTSPSSSTSARSSRSSKSRTSFATAFEDFDQDRKDYRLT